MPFPSPEDLPDSGIEPLSLALQMDSFSTEPTVMSFGTGIYSYSTYPPGENSGIISKNKNHAAAAKLLMSVHSDIHSCLTLCDPIG